MIDYAFHPLANVFPLLEGKPFDELVADIKAFGLHEAIWLYQGQILDGRNRYNVCQALGYDCPTRDYTGNDPLGFVLSMNLQRRHLTESQRAMIANALATLPEGRPTKTASIEAVSQEQAADLLQVSRSSVQRAHAIRTQGAPEIHQAVVDGTLTVSSAEPLMALPPEDQLAALQEAQHEATGKKPTAKQTREVVRRRQGVTTTTAEGSNHTKAAEAVRTAIPKRMSQLLKLVEALANLQDFDQLLLDVPPDWYDRFDQALDLAFRTLNELRTLRKKHRHAVPEVPGRSTKAQRTKKSKKGRPQSKKPSLVALILEAIRSAPQPLTLEDLRQVPGVDRSRLKFNVTRLVKQGNIQETPAGYMVVSA